MAGGVVAVGVTQLLEECCLLDPNPIDDPTGHRPRQDRQGQPIAHDETDADDGQQHAGIARVANDAVGARSDDRLVAAGLDGEGEVPTERREAPEAKSDPLHSTHNPTQPAIVRFPMSAPGAARFPSTVPTTPTMVAPRMTILLPRSATLASERVLAPWRSSRTSQMTAVPSSSARTIGGALLGVFTPSMYGAVTGVSARRTRRAEAQMIWW